METWKDIFVRQVSTGRFWKKLFKDDFERQEFLGRSDAVYICKKAQSDVYDTLIKRCKLSHQLEKFTGELEKMKEELWKEDISDLGMIKIKSLKAK